MKIFAVVSLLSWRRISYERTIDVVFAANGDASGWVEISKSPNMTRTVRVYSEDGPVMRVNGKFAVVRIKGLRPTTRYWYRIGADRTEGSTSYLPTRPTLPSIRDFRSFLGRTHSTLNSQLSTLTDPGAPLGKDRVLMRPPV